MTGQIRRRFFLKILGALGVTAGAGASTTACAPSDEGGAGTSEDAVSLAEYDFVIVGSGAGGAPLAANLAIGGFSVLLLEAGDDQGHNINQQVPAFHGKSTEDPSMRWDYFVEHYADPMKARVDSKYTWDLPNGKTHVGMRPPAGAKPKGVLYPRAGTLGGCTTHNAMITVYPHESDWQKIADITKDSSWSPTNMRRYYERLERCEYLSSGEEAKGHGTKGWLSVSRVGATVAGFDGRLIHMLAAAARATGKSFVTDLGQLIGLFSRDMNAPGKERDQTESMYSIPLAIGKGKRNGPREYLLATAGAKKADGTKKYRLDIRTNCLATRVVFDEAPDTNGNRKAIGVEFLDGKHLYRADPNAAPEGMGGVKGRVRAKREVILAAGAYNTPQLLKLSGVGPKDELKKFGIPLAVDLPGVGTNLQDRYEVGVVANLSGNLSSLEACTFGATATDPCLADWRAGKGIYTTNGAPFGIVKKSRSAEGDADLFVFGAGGYFKGYYPGYSDAAVADKHHFTWAVLKGHTRNQAGTVTLRSNDPRDVPMINFRYFEEGTGGGAAEKDLEAMVDGVEFARDIIRHAGNQMFDWLPVLGGKCEEAFPGPEVKTRDQIKKFVKAEAWGHHASCTCPIGDDADPNAVLDGNFRVRGTNGLRVVDASVFPYIPGLFIVVPIYMISEKAADVILKDAAQTPV